MSQRSKEAIFATCGLAFLTPFVSSFISQQGPPPLIEILFGILPYFAFGLALMVVVLILVAKERGPQASGHALKVAAIASVASLFFTLTRMWNDGSYYTVLTPTWSLISVFSLGLFPVKMGPIALLRFLPVCFATGVFWRVWKTRGKTGSALIAALLVYVPFALSIHLLSWIGGAMALSHGDVLSTPDDVFRVLVSAQADGYWTQAQTERFFAPISMQSQNALYGVQAALVFLLLTVLLAGFAVYTIRSLDVLAKRLLTRSTLLLAVSALLGLGLGLLLQGGSISYTEVIACIVFFVVLIAWLGWWRLARDIVHLSRDEREQPSLPLPSGLVSVQDAESLRDVCLALVLYGAFLLGWPVLISFVCASLLTWIDLRVEWPSRLDVWCRAAASGLIAGCVGSAALAMAVSDAVEPQWMIRLLLAVAVLAGLVRLSRSLDRVLPARLPQVAVLCGGIGLALFFANQLALWVLFLPCVAAVFLLARNEEKWREYRIFPVYLLLASLVFVAVFVSQWLVKA